MAKVKCFRCQVDADDNTEVNGGFTIESRNAIDLGDLASPVCCGSNALRPDSNTEKTGEFTRSAAGGSLKVCQFNWPVKA